MRPELFWSLADSTRLWERKQASTAPRATKQMPTFANGFGTVEDFLLTSMSSQLDSLSFIKEGSTRRKEILAKFLDLDIFEKKFKLAHEDGWRLKRQSFDVGWRYTDYEW